MNALILIILLQQSGFQEPPSQVPGFIYWTNIGTWGNAADEPARMTVPPDIDFREYLNGHSICSSEAEAPCTISIHFRLTLNSNDPETATRAVVQYLITGPSGVRYEGFAWIHLDEPGRRMFIVVNKEWAEQRPAGVSQGESRMIDALLRSGKRNLAASEP